MQIYLIAMFRIMEILHYRTGVISAYIRHQNTPIKERKNRQHTRHQILAVR